MSKDLTPVRGMSAVTALRWKYLKKKGWSKLELSRQVGRSNASITFLMSGRTKGLRPLRAGDIPLARLVDAALGIPREERDEAEAIDRRAESNVEEAEAEAVLRELKVRGVASSPYKRSGSSVGRAPV